MADRFVAMGQQAVTADDDGDAHPPQGGEDVRELRRHEPAADDDQMLGKLGYPHDVVAGVVLHTALGDGGWDVNPGARGDDHLVGGELLAVVGAQRVPAVGLSRPKPGVAGVHPHVGQAALVLFAAGRDRIYAALEDAVDDVGPADLVDRGVDAVPGALADGLGDLGGVDEHLGGNAPDVEAGATEGALLADCHPHVAVPGGRRRDRGCCCPSPYR